MGQRHAELPERLIEFIGRQRLFFVATATPDSRINLSPKGMDTLRVMDSRRVVWLNVTGSGNETSAHVQRDPRMTLMFCAFEGPPMILRLYGSAKVIHRCDPQWGELSALFGGVPGARQVFDLAIDLVQTSCGLGVPRHDYAGERELREWAVRKGEDGIERYWVDKNAESIDGMPTCIAEKNLGDL